MKISSKIQILDPKMSTRPNFLLNLWTLKINVCF